MYEQQQKHARNEFTMYKMSDCMSTYIKETNRESTFRENDDRRSDYLRSFFFCSLVLIHMAALNEMKI